MTSAITAPYGLTMRLIDRETLTRVIKFSAENPKILDAFKMHYETSFDRYYKHTKEWGEWTSEEARDEWIAKIDQE